MAASTDIKFFVHTNNSAPQLTNNYGCMLSVLDAALINGIQVGAVNSLTTSDKIVTAVFGTAHNLMQYQVIKIVGANQAEYNVEARILTVPNATTITFELAAVPSVATATGTINCLLPSLGWEKPFSSTSATGGKGAYRSKNNTLFSRPFLRVIDDLDPVWGANYSKFAKVGIVEDMTDIDTMIGTQSPYDTVNPSKNWVGSGSGTGAYNGWAKWYYATSISANGYQISDPNSNRDQEMPNIGVRKWVIVGNSDSFIIANTASAGSDMYLINGFGKFINYYPGDSYNDYLASHVWYQPASRLSSERGAYQGLVQGAASNMIFTARPLSGAAVGSSGTASAQRITGTGNANVSSSLAVLGELIYTQVDFWADGVFRGRLPFIHWSYQLRPLSNRDIFIDDEKAFIVLNTEFADRTHGQAFLQIAGDL